MPLPRPSRRTVGTSGGVAVLAATLAACTDADDAPGPEDGDAPTDRLRPLYHYAPSRGRLADPNGLVLLAGEYHLFHQQDGTWAHAVAPDLVRWTERPTALEHDALGQASRAAPSWTRTTHRDSSATAGKGSW